MPEARLRELPPLQGDAVPGDVDYGPSFRSSVKIFQFATAAHRPSHVASLNNIGYKR